MAKGRLRIGNEIFEVSCGLEALIVVRRSYDLKKINRETMTSLVHKILSDKSLPFMENGTVAVVGQGVPPEAMGLLRRLLGDQEVSSFDLSKVQQN